ncbi:MAG: CoA transferase [Pseudomonadales bacterium]|nr:CoA transferase [Pseudomonadales bacterium]
MTAPMQGLRVLEVASWLAAPSCAALMADMGADVIKVEPPSGDTYRQLYASLMGQDFVHPTFEFDNRGKRGVVIDFEQDEGRTLLLELAKDVDIFITNLTMPRLERYGLSYDAIRAVAPKSIYAVLSAFGTEGPDSERQGFDQSAFWARTGAMSVSGDATSPPSLCRGGFGDHTSALNLLAASLAALRVRDQTGESQYVEVTLQRTGIWALAGDVTTTLYSRVQPQRHDPDRPSNPAWNYYQTADGRWLLLVMPMAMPFWPAFSKLMGYPEWIKDDRFQNMTGLLNNGPEIVPMVRETIATATLEDWSEKLDNAGLIWAPVAELPEVVEDPALRAVGAFETINHPRAGAIETIAAPMEIRGADIAVRGPAPELGQHSREVFTELGLKDERLDDLFKRGVLV